MALSLGVPPEVVPENGGWPVSGLLSAFRQAPVLAAVGGLPEQETGGDPSEVDRYVPTSETQANGGSGRAPGRGNGINDPAPPSKPEATKVTTAEKPGDENSFDPATSERLPERSAANFTEFENEDGSVTRQVYESRVNYRAADGTYQPIDASLTRAGDRLDAGANSIEVSLGARGAEIPDPAPATSPSISPSASIEPSPSASVPASPSATVSPSASVSPSTPASATGMRVESADEALASVTTASGHTMAFDLAGASPVPAVVDGDTATYPEILPGTDLELRSLNDGLKENIILKSPAAGNEWVFPLKLEGLTPKQQADGSIDLVTAAGTVAMRIPRGYMQDSKVDPQSGAPAESADVHYELITVDGGPALKVTADAAWLNDPARQYPVRIDPPADWTIYDVGDVFADDSTATEVHNGDNLPVGTHDGGTTRSRSFLKFTSFDKDLGGMQIRSAQLRLFHTWSYNCSNSEPVYVHRITESWDVDDLAVNGKLVDAPSYSAPIATWTIGNNEPACNNTGSDRGVGEFRSVYLPVKTFNGWSSGITPNYGLALTASETNSAGFKRFTSANYGGVTTDPHLVITYDYNVDAQVDDQYPAYGAAVPTLTPELIADAHDPDNWPKSLAYKFILYSKDSKTEIATSGWISKKSWTVPAGKMVWGETYYWTVMVSDGLTNNAEYLNKHLLVTPVPQPSITGGLSQNSGQGFDPVIGNYTTTVRDAMVTTIGPPLEVSRAYNSIDPRADQAFGAGWSSVIDAKAVEKTATVGGSTVVNTVVVTYPNGRDIAFGRNNDGTYSSPAGQATTFTKLAAGGYTLREKDGTTYEFSQLLAAGKYAISSITDISGRKQTFTYTDNLLSTITAASGRTLDFYWTTTAPKRVAYVATDPVVENNWDTVNTWSYEYTGAALTKVCPPTTWAECRTYQYDDTRSLYQTATANARPYSYWRLTESSGTRAESAMLENGGADVGTYSAGVTLGQPGPLTGTTATAAGFNGTNASLQLPAKLVSDGTNQAISMWFKTNGGDGVLYGQSLEPANSTATSTKTVYHPTLYIGTDGKLRGGFPKAPKPNASLGTLLAGGQGQCLTVPGNSSTNGVVLVLANCTGAANQTFFWNTDQQLAVTTGGVVKCLDTDDQGVTNGADLVINTCNATYATQDWDVQADGQIIHTASGLCMDAVGDGTNLGAPMQIWACSRLRPGDQLFSPSVHTPMVSTKTVADGKWYHVLLSASGNKQELYIDGDEVARESGVTVQDLVPNSSFIGKGYLGGGWPSQSHPSTASNLGHLQYFTGAVAEVALFDTAVDKQVVTDLYNARGEVKQLTRVLRPSGKDAAVINYDAVTGRVSQMVDGNGTTWKPKPPAAAGTSKVYESAVLGGAPTNYWRMAEAGGNPTNAKNEVNGSVATYNSVTLGANAGPFGTVGTAGTFNGTSSYLQLPSGVAPAGNSSVSMWFKTGDSRTVLAGMRHHSTNSATTYDVPTMWITADGKLRALSPSSTPTGPINSVGVAGKCIDIANNSSANYTPVQVWTCNGSAAQNWSLVPANSSNSKFTLRAFNNTMCVTPYGSGTTNGTLLNLWPCNGSATQEWQASSGRFYHPYSGRCLDNPGASKTDGTDLELFDCNTSAAQTWLPSLTSKNAVNDNKWHHAVLTTNGTSQTLYVDGVKTQSSTGTTPMTPQTLPMYTVGLGYIEGIPANFYYVDSSNNFFTGSIAEVAFYASEIDANQASYQYKAKKAASDAPSGEIRYTISGPNDEAGAPIETTTVMDLMYGRKVADIDALGEATRYGYSGKGNLRTVTDANGNMTINEYDARGNVATVTTCQDRSANICSTSYSTYWLDASKPADVRNDRLTELRGPGSTSVTDNRYLTKYEYDQFGNRIGETDPLGRKTTITYTDGTTNGGFDSKIAPAGLPWKIVKPDGGMQTILYHPSGDIAQTTDPAGSVTRYTYDGLGRKIQDVEVLDTATPTSGSTTTYKHDRLDRVVEVTDTPVKNAITSATHTPVTTIDYDTDGLILSETVSDATGGDAPRTVSYGYDYYGRRTSETDELNNTTEFEYDAYGRVVKQTHPDDTSVRTTYDKAGNEYQTFVDDPDAEEPADPLRTLTYDPAGRVASEIDAMGQVTKYTYTDNNLLATVTRTNGCDPAATPGCTPQSFLMERNSYDDAGNLKTQVTNNGLTTTNYTYDYAGRRLNASVDVTETDGSTTTTSTRTTTYGYSYNDDVVSTQLSEGSTVLASSEQMFDRLGRVQQQTTYLTSGLTPTARWKLNQTSGATATDTAGNNSGTVEGAVTWSTAEGGAASFTGTTAGSIVGKAPVDTLRPYTISGWAKLANKDAGSRYVFSLAGDIGHPVAKVYFDKATDAWRMAIAVRQADGTNAWVTGHTYTTGSATLALQHLALVVTPATTSGGTSTARLYVGGVEKSKVETTQPLNNRATEMRIGAESATTGTFAGLINDVQTYQKALTTAELGQLVARTAPAADARVSRTSYGLTADGSVTSVTDPKGNITNIENDEIGRAVVTVSPEVSVVVGEGQPEVTRRVTRIGYNTFGEVTEQLDPNGNKTINRYDGVGRMVESQSPAYKLPGTQDTITATKKVKYNAVGQVDYTLDAADNKTSYEYDVLGRTTKVTAPDNGVSTYEYTPNGDVATYTDPRQATVKSTYDYLGRTLTSTAAVRQTGSAHTTEYDYGSGPWPTKVTSPGGIVTAAAYNSVGELIRVTDGAGNITKTKYDGAGRLVKTIAADNSYTTVVYDFAGRETKTDEYAANGTTPLRTHSQEYDVTGNPVAITDARNTRKTFEYDALGQLALQREPISASDTIETSFGYDQAGNQTRFTDGRLNKFITTYNEWGLVASQIEPATASRPNAADRTFTLTYDITGHIERLDSPGGVSIASDYDEMGRLIESSGSGAEATTVARTFDYDDAGRMTSFSSSAGTNTIEYDDRGLVTSIAGVSGNSAYEYDDDGQLTKRVDGAGTTSYTYDKGRLFKVENIAAGVDMTYGYDSLNQVNTIAYAGGNTRTLGYDNLHRLNSDELRTPTGSIAKIAYEWNANDSLTKKTTTGFNGASTNTYTYDLADRLRQWDNGVTPVIYDFDKSGNRVQAGTKTFEYDQRNQLVKETSSGTTYQYTARGTLASTTTGGQTVTTVTDAFNQVVAQGNRTGGGTTTYTYDGLGRAIKNNLTYTGLGNDVAADGTTTYVRDVADSLIGVSSAGGNRYAWTDTHTDVVAEFTGTGSTLNGSVSYDPWGKVLASSGMTGRLGYQQEWTEQGTGKVNMWSRWYDPETGAFDTRDTANNSPNPASGAANRFAYAEGDPMSNTDTTGNAVDGKCGEYDYACAVKQYQAELSVYTTAMDQRDRDMKAIGTEIANQEAEYQRAAQESQTPLLDILLQVGIGMLLDIIGWTALEGCLGGSLWDCADLASNALGPIKAVKMGRSLLRAAEQAFSGYRMWKRIVDGAATAMRRSQDLMNQARKMLNDVMQKVPKKPKPPKKKIKPAAKKKPKPKPKPEPKPQPSKQAKQQKPKTEVKKESRPDKAKPSKPKAQNNQPQNKRPDDSDSPQRGAEEVDQPEPAGMACDTHSFDPSTLVLMADGSTRPIADITIGDEVQAKDPITGEEGARQVILLHSNRDLELTDITVTSQPSGQADKKSVNEGKGDRSTRGPTDSSVLETTAHHPFWDATTGEWVDAADLIPGESTLVGPDGEIQYVTKVRNYTGAKVMRDLTVDDIHTYYVLAGNAPVLVHNCLTDRALRMHAEALHNEHVKHIKDDGKRRKAHGKITVVTAMIGNKKYYAVSSNKSSKAMRDLAEKLGYERISGKQFLGIDPRQTHAEHIIMNAHDQGRITGYGRMAPSRQPCRPNTKSYQACAVRAAAHSSIRLVGWP
ncbi:ricin-type beta-trefoil lectin domain protein [Actinoplanes campanulatus]|uniref:ricin-type beta-trefoil lectin domain protein n=1 Tax=Actinoplanes campanulatus TaxID=113559 RepID=UPI0019547FEA|nr:ricin-type beta-trefoil lectin domain protein [Actinoplanes capillaceus]